MIKRLQLEKLRLIGEGAQGIVYLIDAGSCVKIYKKKKFFQRELACLQKGRGEAIFPKVHEWGDNMIIREYIPGVPLSEYLKSHEATPGIFLQLLQIYQTLERLRFKRLDTRLDHIIITHQGKLRLIDPTNLMNDHETYPRRMLTGLERAGCKTTFLKFVAEKEPRLAARWIPKGSPGKRNGFLKEAPTGIGH